MYEVTSVERQKRNKCSYCNGAGVIEFIDNEKRKKVKYNCYGCGGSGWII